MWSTLADRWSYNRRMNDPAPESAQPANPPSDNVLFKSANSPAPSGGKRDWLPWIIAVVAIVFIIGFAVFIAGHRGPPAGSASAIDPYAAYLSLSDVHASQASNFAGDQLTYIDGTISNNGNRTVTSITVRVQFLNDEGEPPHPEQLPLSLIRTRQPYVDTEPVSAAPLRPGASQDFRLIFDHVPALWNQQVPQVKVTAVGIR
jgi:hypothetical protein